MASSNLDPRLWKSWELDPSTRESVHLLTKSYPVDVTLATPGTAEALFSVSPGIATVNLVTNPSCETSDPPDGYSAVNSATLAQDATYYNYGSKSLKITPPDAVKGEGAYWDLGTISHKDPLSISAYFRRAAGSGSDARVELVASSITGYSTYTNVRLAVGNTVTLGTGWTRSYLTSHPDRETIICTITPLTGTFEEDEEITGGTSGSTATIMTVDSGGTWLAVSAPSGQFSPELGIYATETIEGGSSSATATLTAIKRIKVDGNLHLYMVTATKHGDEFYVDGVQAEYLENVTAYCDGAQGAYHWWDGTAHASTSRRWKKLSCIRGYRLHCTKDIYIAFDIDADSSGTNAEDKGEYISAGSDFGEDTQIFLDDKISFVNAVTGEYPRLYGRIYGT